MRKCFSVFVLSFLVLVLCSGCDGDVTRALRHDGFNVSSTEFDCDVLTDDATEKVKFLLPNNIITDTGRIYELSLSQKFSNNSHCKAVDTGLKLDAVFDNKVFKADNGKIYYLASSNNSTPYTEVTAGDNSYYLYELLLKPEGTIKVVTADSSNGLYYVLKSDGNVYSYTIDSSQRNSSPKIVSTVVVYDRNFYGGNIIDFNYAGDSPATFVRSAYKVYRMKATNSEECTKYADVQCSYAMAEAEAFNEYSDSILAYNGSTLITTYKKIFTAS